jgi:hypothetical protein
MRMSVPYLCHGKIWGPTISIRFNPVRLWQAPDKLFKDNDFIC